MKLSLTILLFICLSSCSDADEKNGATTGTSGGTTTTAPSNNGETPFRECDNDSYEVDYSYVTDDPDDPSGGRRYCNKIPTACKGLENNVNASTNNSTSGTNNSSTVTNNVTSTNNNSTNEFGTAYCQCLVTNTEENGFCECIDGVVTCSESG